MLCVPIIAKNTEEAIEKILRANELADILEIRLDLMGSFRLAEVLQATSRPVIVTYRSKREGGCGLARYETQTHYLLDAIKAGADFVDVEYKMPLEFRHELFKRRGTSKIIISTHIRNGTPQKERLERILKEMASTGADAVKIVTNARSPEDNLSVLGLIPVARKLGIDIIAFCMGPKGRISRVLSHLMGGYVTFASLGEGEESADGQIPIMEMKKILEYFSP
ncbi:MAG: type I 3-dehydroquinate dehydratase [Pseudomonadota bacterium]